MHKTIFVILSISLTFVSCNDSFQLKIKSSEIGVGGDAYLITAPLTRSTSATIQILCHSGSTHYIESSSTPAASDSGWATCSSENFTISKSLAAGDNNFKFWFKKSQTVISASSVSLLVKSGNTFKLNSPFPTSGGFFGGIPMLISSTRFLLLEPYATNLLVRSGAVHIYNQLGELVNSIYGESAYEFFGGDPECSYKCFGSVHKLSNNRFAVASPTNATASGTLLDAGAVFVYDQNGVLLFRVDGDGSDDIFGSGGVTELSNGNLVIASPEDEVSGVARSGSVKLINGNTGVVIASITGDNANDYIGLGSITPLNNGNFVVLSVYDDVSGITNAGSVKLVNGATGAVISSITGDNANDYMGSGGVYSLSNGNFVMNSSWDDILGMADAGSVKLVNGATGAIISSIAGDNANDQMGRNPSIPLSNGNYVVNSPRDNVSGVTGAGSIKLVNGTTGVVISTIAGNDVNDKIGEGGSYLLNNGNFVVNSPYDDVPGATDGGSVKLINGNTGVVIASIEGDNANDWLGDSGTIPLSNGNFALKSSYDDVPGATDGGSVKLINGSTGVVIASIEGDNTNDSFGSFGVYQLNNGNFVINSPLDDVLGIINAGSAKIINANTGAVIVTIAGDNTNDKLGLNGCTQLNNGNFVLRSSESNLSGVANVGLAQLINGNTGIIIATVAGDNGGDFFGTEGLELPSGDIVITARSGDGEVGYAQIIPAQ